MSTLTLNMRSAMRSYPTLASFTTHTRAYSDRPSSADSLLSAINKAANTVSDFATKPLEKRDGQYTPRQSGGERIHREDGGRSTRPSGMGGVGESRQGGGRGGDGTGFSSFARSLDRTSSDREVRPRGPRFNQSGPGSRDSPSDGRPPRPKGSVLTGTMAARAARPPNPPALITLAQLTVPQISNLISSALVYKHLHSLGADRAARLSLHQKSVALLFSKRSTRTRVASESAAASLGGKCMFLGKDDIQLGVNESEEDTARVIGSMVDGIMARVGAHSEIENLAKFSPVPVINALSDLYHPTQILADLMTLVEIYNPPKFPPTPISELQTPQRDLLHHLKGQKLLAPLEGKKIAWVGDTNNITNDMLVCFPRLGMEMSLASPKGYDKVDERVWAEVVKAGTEGKITLTNSPEEALKGADIVATDTWISMGQETEKASRLAAFAGYQVTEALCSGAGANPDWKFLHCLPRKQEEVDDDVFYGKRSVVFQEAENRKWTTMACFSNIFGDWKF